MAILSKDGQLLANASQRTLVFDTDEQLQEFKASLPAGVNIDESFDIYVKELGMVYAAGTPFKLREIVSEEDLEMWFSVDGTGDGLSPDNPAPGYSVAGVLAEYSARYDFNNYGLIINFAPGLYPGFFVNHEFLNCMQVTIQGTSPVVLNSDGTIDSNNCAVFTTQRSGAMFSGPVVTLRGNQSFWLSNIGIINGEGAVSAGNGANVTLHQVAVQYAQRHSMNTGTLRGIIQAEGEGTQIMPILIIGCTNFALCNEAIEKAKTAEDPSTVIPDDAFFFANDGGTIFFPFSAGCILEDYTGYPCYYMGREAVFKCANNGIINIGGMEVQFQKESIDKGVPLSQMKVPGSGWLKVISGGIAKVGDTYNLNPVGDIVCDTTGILDYQKPVDRSGNIGGGIV